MLDRRGAPRYSIIAVAELKQLPGGTVVNGRTSDVSRTGCYVDSLHPMPAGTKISIKLKRSTECFETGARVAYVTPALGMGIVFDDPVPRPQLELLDRWINEASRNIG